MFFYRRDPYYGYSRATGCFVSLLLSLFIVAILVVCAIYIGAYVLFGLLIIGAVVGGLSAVFALFKALPQTIKDMSCQIYRGNKIVVLLKNVGYFFVCIAKYSINNDFQYAKNAYQKFASKRVLSFSKWVNLALAVTVLIFGVLIILGILSLSVIIAFFLLLAVINIVIAFIIIMCAVGLLYNVFSLVKETIHSGKRSFSPICFKFGGRCYFSDLLTVPKSFISQMARWIGDTWTNSVKLLNNHKSSLNRRRVIWFPFSVALIVSCPLSALIIIALASMIIFVIALMIYLLDAIWILVKAVLKF